MSNNLPTVRRENIFTKILNKLKNIIYLNKSSKEDTIKSTQSYENTQNFNSKFREAYKPKELNIEPNSLDYAIDQFIMASMYSLENKGYANPYSVLTTLGSNEIESSNGNDIVEDDLLNNIKASNNFELWEQNDTKTNEPVFHHVRTKSYLQDPKYANRAGEMRFYINTKRKNVALLASTLLNSMKDENLYLKFSSDKQLGKRRRSEAIVIYTDGDDAQKIVENINKIHDTNPELFEGSENKNPFLKDIDGYLSYAVEPNTNEYHDLNGNVKKVANSYNTFLSEALRESVTQSAYEIISTNKELTEKTDGVIPNQEDAFDFYTTYMNLIKEDPNLYREFLNNTKNKLRILQDRNDCLDIKGISEERGEMNNERQI